MRLPSYEAPRVVRDSEGTEGCQVPEHIQSPGAGRRGQLRNSVKVLQASHLDTYKRLDSKSYGMCILPKKKKKSKLKEFISRGLLLEIFRGNAPSVNSVANSRHRPRVTPPSVYFNFRKRANSTPARPVLCQSSKELITSGQASTFQKQEFLPACLTRL